MRKLGFFGRTRNAVLAVAVAVGAFGATAAVRHATSGNSPVNMKLADPNSPPSRISFAPVVKKVTPAVVSISSSKVVKSPVGFNGMEDGDVPDLFRRFFGEDGGFPRGQRGQRQAPRERREKGLGSGVVVSSDGYILTNNHVVDDASDVRVTLRDGREFQAKIVGTDAKTDIAVLKIEETNLPSLIVGDSSKLEIGDFVLAVGNPFGVGQSVTMGIVSATGRGGLGIEEYEDFIQTDAPINPGNSGGALVNERGELVGINTAILSHGSGGNQGIGFAVPVNLARKVTDQIVQHGKVTRAYLGIVPQDVTPAIAKAFNLKENRGALVGDVSPDSPAMKAGIEKGDVILEVNGQAVNSSNQLRNEISMMPTDASVNLKILRNGAMRDMRVNLGELPVKQERASNEKSESRSSLDGVEVETLNAQTARQLGLPPQTAGVVVTDIDPSSQAAASGLRQGDVIQEVNRKPVKTAGEFEQAMSRSGKDSLLLVNRHGTTFFVAA